MTTIGERLLRRAIDAEDVRADLTGADVFTLMNAAAWTREHGSPDQADRLVDLTFHGFTAQERTAPARR